MRRLRVQPGVDATALAALVREHLAAQEPARERGEQSTRAAGASLAEL